MDNYILSYYQQIQDGSVTVGRWIKLVYEYLVKGLENKKFFYNAKKANLCIKFIENFCHHCEGRNDLLKLELWQKALVASIFGIVDENGVRVFREVMLIVARKNGKTLLASAIMACHLFMDDEYGAKIFCLAPKLEQADLVYGDFWQTIEAEPELANQIKRRKMDYYVPSTNSSVKKIAFNAKKADGFNPSLTVCDEISSWAGEQGLRQYEVMKSALGSRKQPIILSISTAGYVNDSIYDELFKRATRFLLGDSKEQRLLPFMYMIDDPTKWSDINELRKSNPNLGVSVSVDYLLEEIAVAEGSISKKTEFLVKYCNIKQNAACAWLNAQDVAKAYGEQLKLEDFRGSYCIAGLDLSRTTDLTCVCVVIQKNGHLYIFSQMFIPAEKVEEATARDGLPYAAYVKRGLLTLSGDNFVDYHDCYNWLVSLIQEYEIYPLRVMYDRYSAQYLVQDLQNYGFVCDDCFQGFNMSPAIKEFDGLMRDGIIHIGDNDLLKIHLLSTALKMEADTERCRIVKLSATEHIDGTAALIDAFVGRQKWWNEIGAQLENEG